MASALIALGGNVGDVRSRFGTAITEICRQAQATLVARSSDYETPPWGGVAQPSFINACIAIETGLGPHALLATLLDIERMFGRDRERETRWGPRTLDLDLIAYDDIALDTPGLTLPHPRLFERAFVLVPLAEIAPDRVIAGRSPRDALSGVSSGGIVRLPDFD
jgi:2-amino-4-hydroxy-6-hydroxymethyldihydropteridine diphosphokinase